MPKPTIRGLLPYYLPPGKFSGVRWFEATGGKHRWFYHKPQGSTPRGVEAEALVTTVDAELVDLVRYIHRNGGTTGPSCAGHVVTPMHHRKVQAAMRNHARKVRSSGLRVRDVETGKEALWRDTDYKVDMDLLSDSLANEKVFELIGYLPVKAGPEILQRLSGAVAKTPCAWAERHGSYLVVWVGCLSANDQRIAWRCITQELSWPQ